MNAICCITFWLLFINVVENKEFCDFVFSLKDSVATINYLNIVEPNNDNDECISPSTTVTENENYGRVYKLISSNLREGVSILYKNTVTRFPHLIQIDMEGNRIREVKSRAFNNLSEVELISLSNNNIEKIEDDAFFQVLDLSTLILSGNKLRSVSPNWFNNLRNLKKLNISRNSINSISNGFGNIINLEVLDVSHNSIFNIDENAFSRLSSLKILDLGYNFIHSFHSNAFLTNKKLRLLNLFNNDLTYIPLDVLESWLRLHELIILYNPFPCDCHQNIIKWLAKKGINLNKNIQCSNIEIGDIPVCITIDGKNCNSALSNQYSVLHSNRQEFKCYLKV